MPPLTIRHEIRPDIGFLREANKLLLTTTDMARFLLVPKKAVQQMVYSDRIPLPLHVGLGKLARWNIFELLRMD